MIRVSWKFLLICVVVAIAISSVAPQADAQWRGYGYGYGYGYGCGYAPCYTSCYTPCYTSCYTTSCYDSCCYGGSWYRGWRPGPIRRLLFGRCKWYRAGYSCPTYDCCTDVSTCCSDAPAAAPALTPTPAQKPIMDPPVMPPTMPAEPAPAPGDMPAPAPAPQTNTTSAETSGVLTVWVPFEAKVTINGLKTTSSGTRRQFISHGLKPGFIYTYVVKAKLVRDGQLLEDTRTVTLTAGKITAVAFGFNATPVEQIAAR